MAVEQPARFRVTVESADEGLLPDARFEVCPFEEPDDRYGHDAQSIAEAVAADYCDSGSVRVEEIGGTDTGRVWRR